MSEYTNGFDDLRGDIARTFEAVSSQGETTSRAIAAIFEEQRQLWAEQAELRDELLAVANRVENLTRAVTIAPAEVAQAMLGQRGSTGRELADAADRIRAREGGTE